MFSWHILTTSKIVETLQQALWYSKHVHFDYHRAYCRFVRWSENTFWQLNELLEAFNSLCGSQSIYDYLPQAFNRLCSSRKGIAEHLQSLNKPVKALQRIGKLFLSTWNPVEGQPVKFQQASFDYSVACWTTLEVQQPHFEYCKACWMLVTDRCTCFDLRIAYSMTVEDSGTHFDCHRARVCWRLVDVW